jgi:large subunit ribosomal protein L13
MKTYSPKPTEITHDWYIIDATGISLGRLSSTVAMHLMGKNKARFAPHMDCGDNVVVINAAHIRITGNKLTDKKYFHHSGYPGGIYEETLGDIMTKSPAKAIERAIKGMLPKNKLTDDRMKRLKVYAGTDHPHAPQSPVTLEVR